MLIHYYEVLHHPREDERAGSLAHARQREQVEGREHAVACDETHMAHQISSAPSGRCTVWELHVV